MINGGLGLHGTHPLRQWVPPRYGEVRRLADFSGLQG